MYKKLLIIFLLYLGIAVFILHGILLKPGIIIGGDWAIPYTYLQIKQQFINAFSTWNIQGTLVGSYKAYLTDISFSSLMLFLSILGFSGAIISKLILLFAYTLGGLSMYVFLRYMKLSTFVSFVGGLIYITSPFFFNYSVMGWMYVLYSMVLFPLFIMTFDMSVRSKKYYLAPLCGLVFSLAMVQSTSLIWYTAVIGALFLTHYKNLKNYLIVVSITLIVFVLSNVFWAFNLFYFPDSIITGSDNVKSSVSLGTWSHLNIANIIRGWGSLFNYSYEVSYSTLFMSASFILLLLAIFYLVNKKSFRISKNTFILLFLVPFFLYLLGSERIVYLPFSNVIRDVARMLVLTSFSLTVLAACGLEIVKSIDKRIYSVLLLIVFINMHPFYTNKLWGEFTQDKDIRLRTYEFPQEYEKVEKFLNSAKPYGKVIYVPLNPALNDYTNDNFNGPYRETAFLFATFSQKQGLMFKNDKEKNGINVYYNSIYSGLQNNFENFFPKILKDLNAHYLVFYFNSMQPSDWHLYLKVKQYSGAQDITQQVLGENSNIIAVYKIDNPTQEVTFPNKLYFVDESVSMQQLATENLLESSATVAYIPLDNPDIGLLSNFETYIGTKRIMNVLNKSSIINWTGTFVWPSVNNSPETLKYKIVRLLESFKIAKTLNEQDKIELHLWYAQKRVAEYQSFPFVNKEYLLNEFANNYSQIKLWVEKLNYDDITESEIGLIIKINYYLSYIKSLNLDIGQNEYKDYSRWLDEFIEDGSRNCMYKCADIKLQENVSYEIITFNNTKLFINNKEYFQGDEIKFTQDDIDNLLVYYSTPDIELPVTYTSKTPDEIISDLAHSNNIKFLTEAIEEGLSPFTNIKVMTLDFWEPSNSYNFIFSYPTLKSKEKIQLIVLEEYETITEEFDTDAQEKNIVRDLKVIATKEIEYNENISSHQKTINSGPLGVKAYVFAIVPENNPNALSIQVEKASNPNILLKIKSNNENTVDIKGVFQKVSQNKYVLKGTATGDFIIVNLKQRFSPYWKLKINLPNGSSTYMDESNHFIANGYSNVWVFSKDEYSINNEFSGEVIFLPQKYTNVFSVVSIGTVLVSLGVVIYGIKSHKRKNS